MGNQKLQPSFVQGSKSRVSSFGQAINDLQAVNASLAAEEALMKFLSPARMMPNAQQREFLDAAELSTIMVTGIPIKTYTWSKNAESPWVMLSHGFMMNAATMLNFVQPLLLAGYQVVTWDHCAHGESGGNWTDMRVWVQSVLTIAQTHTPLAGIVGFSVGGTTALMALAQNPHFQCPVVTCINSPTQIDTVLRGFLQKHGCNPDLIPLMHQVAAEKTILLPEQIRAVLPRCHKFPSTRLVLIQDHNDPIASIPEAEYFASHARNARIEFTQGLKHHGGLSNPHVAHLVTTSMISDAFGSSTPALKL